MKSSENYDKESLRIIEAFIFASNSPVTEKTLRKIVPDGSDLNALLKQLQVDYMARGVNLVCSGESWSFHTASDIKSVLNKEVKKVRLPSRAATEVLAVIAYHQPITRTEIEEIRGVSLSKGTLDFLFELEWIKPKGRRNTPGRPVIWGTTDAFLNHFDLTNIKDLPGIEDLKLAGLLESGPSINLFGNLNDLSVYETKPENEDQDENEKSLMELDNDNLVLSEGLNEGTVDT